MGRICFVDWEAFMMMTSVETIPGRTIIEVFGVVSGNTVRAKHVGRDIAAAKASGDG